MKEFKIQQRTVLGIFVMLIGGLLLFSSMGIIGADLSIGLFWPVILIVLGIVRIINFDESSFTGLIFLILGVYFQLRNFNVAFIENISLSKIFWPAIIIMFGISLILPEKFKNKKKNIESSYYEEKESIDVKYKED